MFTKIFELLAELPTNSALRLEVERLTNRLVEVEAENADLVQRLGEAKRQLSDHAAKQQFVEHRGVLWKRETSGGYAHDPICPTCKLAMNSFQSLFPFECSRCHFVANFHGEELKKIRAELPA